MPVAIDALTPYRSAISDNRRWTRFDPRPGDVYVCSPPKCGTTWTQTIVHSLMWPGGDGPLPVMTVAPWLEAEFNPLDEVLARLAAQTHRRQIKTHTPADGIPFLDDAKYIFVARDGRDAFMSWCNHRANMKAEIVGDINARALADGVPPMPPWDGDVHAFFAQWLADALMFRHVRSYWERRHVPNLLFVHFNDLKADLAGQMRRIAAFLELRVPEAEWPGVVERCRFEAMQARGEQIGTFKLFEGGSRSFLFKGSNGRWRDELTADELVAYARRVAEILPLAAAAWLESGGEPGRAALPASR